MRGDLEDEFDEDYGHDDDSPPYWYGGQRMPDDARAMGLTHHVPDGALLDFAGRLDSGRTYHRVVAWVLLVIFGLPAVFQVVRLVEDLGVH